MAPALLYHKVVNEFCTTLNMFPNKKIKKNVLDDLNKGIPMLCLGNGILEDAYLEEIYWVLNACGLCIARFIVYWFLRDVFWYSNLAVVWALKCSP